MLDLSKHDESHALDAEEFAPQDLSERQPVFARQATLDAMHFVEVIADNPVSLLEPGAAKRLRSFTSGEAAELIKVSDGYLRQLSLAGIGPHASRASQTGRRAFSLDDVNAIRQYLAKRGGTKGRRYLAHRAANLGEELQVIAVSNLKRGSGRTTTAAHLAQYLALRGYRVLAIDIDPDASMSTLLGMPLHSGFGSQHSIFEAMSSHREDSHTSSLILETYFPGLHLIPADATLQKFEHVPAVAQNSSLRPQTTDLAPLRPLKAILLDVADQYDVVVVDCPPHLGPLTLSCLFSATIAIVPVQPDDADIRSVTQFLSVASDYWGAMHAGNLTPNSPVIRYLITQQESNHMRQTQVAAQLRARLKAAVMNNALLKSEAFSDAAMRGETLYERGRGSTCKSVYDRAVESLDFVNAEIETLIRTAWKGNGRPAGQEQAERTGGFIC